MEDIPSTPPVVDPAALHPKGWDGVERRKADPVVAAIAHAVKQAPPGVQPDGVGRMVMYVSVMALQLLTLILMFKLSGDINTDTRKQEEFRDGVSCFLVETVQPSELPTETSREQAATAILRRCGFIETPGNEE